MKFLPVLLLLTFSMTFSSTAQHVNSPLEFLIRKPSISTKNPKLLVLLHGVGSNELDLFSFESKIPTDFYVISARAPITLSQNSYAWYHVDFSTGKPVFNLEEEKKSREILIDFIHQLKDSFSISTENVFLAGFSQGAIMSYSVALTEPDLVHGIAVFSGRLLEEIKPTIQKDQLTDLKVFISHGKQDPMLPFYYANAANDYLKSIGITPILHEYEAKHEISVSMFTDFLNWLSEK